MIVRLGIHREIETVIGIGLTMLAGVALVALSIVVMLRVTAAADPLAREDIAFRALSSPSRPLDDGDAAQCRGASDRLHVPGERSHSRRDGGQGMPLVVEISVAFSILIAFIVIRNFSVPHS